jgi:hypothetical protein
MFSFLLSALGQTKAHCEIVDPIEAGKESRLMSLCRLVYADKAAHLSVSRLGLLDHMALSVET